MSKRKLKRFCSNLELSTTIPPLRWLPSSTTFKHFIATWQYWSVSKQVQRSDAIIKRCKSRSFLLLFMTCDTTACWWVQSRKVGKGNQSYYRVTRLLNAFLSSNRSIIVIIYFYSSAHSFKPNWSIRYPTKHFEWIDQKGSRRHYPDSNRASRLAWNCFKSW